MREKYYGCLVSDPTLLCLILSLPSEPQSSKHLAGAVESKKYPSRRAVGWVRR